MCTGAAEDRRSYDRQRPLYVAAPLGSIDGPTIIFLPTLIIVLVSRLHQLLLLYSNPVQRSRQSESLAGPKICRVTVPKPGLNLGRAEAAGRATATTCNVGQPWALSNCLPRRPLGCSETGSPPPGAPTCTRSPNSNRTRAAPANEYRKVIDHCAPYAQPSEEDDTDAPHPYSSRVPCSRRRHVDIAWPASARAVPRVVEPQSTS